MKKRIILLFSLPLLIASCSSRKESTVIEESVSTNVTTTEKESESKPSEAVESIVEEDPFIDTSFNIGGKLDNLNLNSTVLFTMTNDSTLSIPTESKYGFEITQGYIEMAGKNLASKNANDILAYLNSNHDLKSTKYATTVLGKDEESSYNIDYSLNVNNSKLYLDISQDTYTMLKELYTEANKDETSEDFSTYIPDSRKGKYELSLTDYLPLVNESFYANYNANLIKLSSSLYNKNNTIVSYDGTVEGKNYEALINAYIDSISNGDEAYDNLKTALSNATYTYAVELTYSTTQNSNNNPIDYNITFSLDASLNTKVKMGDLYPNSLTPNKELSVTISTTNTTGGTRLQIFNSDDITFPTINDSEYTLAKLYKN